MENILGNKNSTMNIFLLSTSSAHKIMKLTEGKGLNYIPVVICTS